MTTLHRFTAPALSLLTICFALALSHTTLAEPSEIDGGRASSAATRASAETRPFSIGARAALVPTVGVAGFVLGLDAAYSVIPNLAVGAQYLAFDVDQGADPQYCRRCIHSGNSSFVFAEGRLWPHTWVTPYARFGGGLSHLKGQRFEHDEGYTENDFTLLAEAGLELHYGPASLRMFAFDHEITGSLLDEGAFRGFGAQLGVRF